MFLPHAQTCCLFHIQWVFKFTLARNSRGVYALPWTYTPNPQRDTPIGCTQVISLIHEHVFDQTCTTNVLAATEYQEQNGHDTSCEHLPGLQAACFHLVYTSLCWVQANVINCTIFLLLTYWKQRQRAVKLLSFRYWIYIYTGCRIMVLEHRFWVRQGQLKAPFSWNTTAKMSRNLMEVCYNWINHNLWSRRLFFVLI